MIGITEILYLRGRKKASAAADRLMGVRYSLPWAKLSQLRFI